MKTSALLLAAVLAAAASAAPARAEDPGVTRDSIRIGMFGPITGPASVFSKSLLGAEAIYKDINDHGGINGRRIELVVEDDGCDPNKGIAAVKKLAAQDRVFLVHGGWCSNVVMAVLPQLGAGSEAIPFMDLGAASSAISTPSRPNVFQPVATADAVTRTMVAFGLSKPGAKRFAIIGHSDEWGKSHLEGSLDALKAHGLAPVESVAFERGATDATSQILRLRQAKPDVVLAILYPAELAIFLRDSRKYGLHAVTLGTQAVSVEDTAQRVGSPDAVKDLYVFYPLSAPIDSPQFARWAEIFRKYNPGETIDTISFISMSGSLAVAEAIRRMGGDVTREGLIGQLDHLADFDPGIQSAPLTFTAAQHAGIASGKMAHLSNGKVEVLDAYPAGS